MPSSTFGEFFRITTFGESHGKAVGVVIDGVKPDLDFDLDAVQKELNKRRPGHDGISSTRRESDDLEILSGIFDGKTTGAPICLVIHNRDARSSDYENVKNLFRPGHSDFVVLKKYGIRDYRGGGRTSGRETAARVAAGAFARQLLADDGIEIFGFVSKAAGIRAKSFDRKEISRNPVKCPDAEAAKLMIKAIEKAMSDGDSVGGIVEIRIKNLPAGLGDPVFDKLNARLGQALLSIPSVKGVEFGDGFALADVKGSQANDCMDRRGFLSNHAGGIAGGISTGQEIIIRIAVKPASSIRKIQKTVDIHGQEVTFSSGGRHDPCICPRIVPVAESMTAVVILDAWLRQKSFRSEDVTLTDIRALIEGCDNVIIEALARRMLFAEQAGRLKKKKRMAIEDKNHEKEVIAHFSILAKEFGFDEENAIKLAEFIIGLSKQHQRREK
jgi:chorismate synthase